MRKNRFLLFLALLFFLSCTTGNYWRLRIEVPGETVLDLNQFDEIVITNFFIKEETKDFDLNQELVDYIAVEIGQDFKGKTSIKKINLENDEFFKNEDFWKNLSEELKEAVFFTGSAHYTKEVRKSILKSGRERFEDRYSAERAVAERRFYNLELTFYLIDAKTGKTLYKRNFKESKGYKNPKQTARFAFFDLLERAKTKLFYNLLGGSKIQERYLIFD